MRGGPPEPILSAAEPTLACAVQGYLMLWYFSRLQRKQNMAIKHISDSSFDQDVLKSDTPVLVDFWAEWCGPCKMIAPILDEVSRDYDGRLQVAKVNVDENQALPAKFGVRGIPTLILFKNGAQVATKVGAVSKSQLTLFIDSHL
jgi:thioredoxin 1